MIKEYQRNKKDPKAKGALVFIKQKLDSAKWFIDAIKQRQNTLLITMEAIMEHQRDFFLTGDETKMKPMILKDIAEKVSMDISTCLLYTSPSPRDRTRSRMPSSA